MAKIAWEDEPKLLLGQFVEYAAIEYGKSTALRWAKEVQSFENRVKSFPEAYPPEELLLGRSPLFRRRHLMNRRFKILYYYDEAEDVVHIVDIWDTKRNPSALIRRIK
jgi:plasmid stabilization system protein ParE